MKEHVIRLFPGDDVVLSLEAYCRKYNIEAGYIATCVGSLSEVTFRKGLSRQIFQLNGEFEIVSMVGILSKGGNHLHCSISNSSLQVYGGHMIRGCVVQSTAEIVLVELEDYQLTRSKGELSGFKELKINSNIKLDEHDES